MTPEVWMLDRFLAEFKDHYDRLISRLINERLSEGPIDQGIRVPWMCGLENQQCEWFKYSGLYIWGAEQRPIYVGMTKTGTFRGRLRRYLWEGNGEWSQCGLAKKFEHALIKDGLAGFPEYVHEWYRRRSGSGEATGGGKSRLNGSVRFAREGIGAIWFAIFPITDQRFIKALESLLIPIANDWNIQHNLAELENVQENRLRPD